MIGFKSSLCALIGALLLLSGCVTKPLERKDYTELRKANLHSILVVPALSRAVDVDAPDYFLSTIAKPIAERGYYVFPVNLIKRLMEDDGLSDAHLVHTSDTVKLASLFGADSVLYIVIERWDSKYAILSTVTTVELSYILKSGSTGQELWTGKAKLAYDPAAQNSQNGLAGLIAKAVIAALEKSKPNFIPMARQVNVMAVYRNGQGLPAGPYDVNFQKDNEQF